MRAHSAAPETPRWHRPVLRGCCAVAAGLYSLWLLGTWLNPELDALNGYVSELAAQDQPASWLFRGGDALTGVLTITAATLALLGKPDEGRVGWLGLGTFGAATAVDSGFTPMACASFADSNCAVRELVGALPITHALHEVTSSVAGIAVLVGMGGLAHARTGPPVRWGWAWCAVTGLATILTLVALWVGVGAGIAQGVQLAGIATWLLALAITGPRPTLISAGATDA